MGTVPLPASLKGFAATVFQKFSGAHPEVLIDKLGERLAFERGGVRLYEYLIGKCEAMETDPEIPIEQLQRFRDEEAQHFAIVAKALESLGADPTAVTPCANVTAVASIGNFQGIERSAYLHFTMPECYAQR